MARMFFIRVIRVIRGSLLVPLYSWQRDPFISLPTDPPDSP